MNYTITSGQIGYFKDFGNLPIEEFLTAKEKELLQTKIRMAKEDKDLWRKDGDLFALVHSKKIMQILSLLLDKPLRLLKDQVLKTLPPSLQEGSCFREIVLAVLFQTNGGVLFIDGKRPLPELPLEESYLVCYGYEKTLFVENFQDPFSPLLKKMGYSYGDLLKEKTHPMVSW